MKRHHAFHTCECGAEIECYGPPCDEYCAYCAALYYEGEEE